MLKIQFLTLAVISLLTVSAAAEPNIEDLTLPPIRGQVGQWNGQQAHGNSSFEMNYNNLYLTLKVPQNATIQQIRASYGRLAKLSHPDLNPNASAASRQMFLRVQEAWDILSDPQLRAGYDEALRQGRGAEFVQNPKAFKNKTESANQFYNQGNFADLPFSQLAEKRGRYAQTLNEVMGMMALDPYVNRKLQAVHMQVLDLVKSNRLCQLFALVGVYGAGVTCGLISSAQPEMGPFITIGSLMGVTGVWALFSNQQRAYIRSTAQSFQFYLDSVMLLDRNLVDFKKSIVAFDMVESLMSHRLDRNSPNFGRDWYTSIRVIAARLPAVYEGLMFRYLQGSVASKEWVSAFERNFKFTRFMWRGRAFRIVSELQKHGHLTPEVLNRARELFGENFAKDIEAVQCEAGLTGPALVDRSK